MSSTILISGGAGYIGSHAAYVLKKMGCHPVVIDNLSTGNSCTTRFGSFEKGDVGNAAFVRAVCEKYNPIAAMHFAAFIEVNESLRNPAKYFENNCNKTIQFFKILHAYRIRNIVFSSTAAVYGEIRENKAISETQPTKPINPYGQSKLEAEIFARALSKEGMHSVSLRYFNVAGAAPVEAQIGEAHFPETHLIPRLILPLIDTPQTLLTTLGLQNGFTVYGNDYPTPDGTAIRDYVHVMDIVDAHVKSLDYLLRGGQTDIFNLGSGTGFSVMKIIEATRQVLGEPGFMPHFGPRREGDPSLLVASNEKAHRILGWQPKYSLSDIIKDAVAWHRSPRYLTIMQAKADELTN